MRRATGLRGAALGARMSRRSAFTLVALLAGTAGAQLPPDLEELCAQLDAAHRTAEAAPVTAFRADLRLRELARDAQEHRGELELHVEFRQWVNPETGGPWNLIRYRQIDSARSVEQGRDRISFWSIVDGKPQDMMAKEMENDRANCRRNLKLADQMTRFLQPGAMLRTLAEPTAVTDTELTIGRTDKVDCRTVSGHLTGFPLMRNAGDNVPVAARVWVSREDHRLVALEVTPLDAQGKPQAGNGELLRFDDYRPSGSCLVPARITHFAVAADGKRSAETEIAITHLDLEHVPEPADFDRPKEPPK